MSSSSSDTSLNHIPAQDKPEVGSSSGSKFKLTWQELLHCTQYISDKSWSATPLPPVLDVYPENIVISQQLRQILSWSLRRFEELQPDSPTPEHPHEDVGSTPVPTRQSLPTRSNTVVAAASLDRHDSSTLPMRAKSQKTLPLITRLNKLRQDVASKLVSTGPAKSSDATNSQPASSKAAAEEVNPLGECISCFDEFSKNDLVHLTCSHDYCKPCLREVVFTAMKNEAAFPPKCCLTEIALKTVLVCLDNKQRAEYKAKSAEYAIPAGHRWYCPEPKCSKWIRPENLQRDRRTPQTCPHCKASICSMCRSLAHDTDQDCPQDFGLESTLEIAESEGWRRCYSCRTMVELTTGCRHITCRCGAEFCYVCNARWRTCNCTEADKERRIRELRAQREQRTQMQEEERRRIEEEDEAARVEAEEMAEAIRQIEEIEREEAIRRVEEERRRQLEEELALARLEEARLLEEIARREQEEAAEKQFREILITSSKEECQAMMKTLVQIINYQHATLMSGHATQEQTILKEHESQKARQVSESDTKLGWLQENIKRRTLALDTKQKSEWEALLLQTENEEDEMFMHMHMHLRGKPNREQREKRMRDAFQRHSHERTERLQQQQQMERESHEMGVRYEFEGLGKAASVQLEPLKQTYEANLERFGLQVGCDRQWLQLVSTRRIHMLNEHKRLVLEQLEAEEDPMGLTEDQARSIEPILPAMDDDTSTGSHEEGIQQRQNESADLYSTSGDGQNVPPETTDLRRSDTVIRFVPGAFPESIITPTQSRPQSLSILTQSANPTMIMERPRPLRPKSVQSSTSTASTSSSTPNTSAQATFDDIITAAPNPSTATPTLTTPTTNASTTNLSPTTKHLSNDSHSSASTSTSTSTASSTTSTTSSHTSTTPSFLDDIPNAIIARHSQSESSGKGKGIVGRFRFGKKKEVSEEEIKRRMSKLGAGDGIAGWGAFG